MNFGFGSSFFLWLLPILGIPILIHILEKKHAILHPFAANEFVLKSIEKAKKKINLKNLLLLILRTLSVLLLILLFSDFGLRSKLSSQGSSVPKDVIIVLDASASMQWREGTEPSFFDTAKKKAEQFVAQRKGEDRLAVVVFAEERLVADRALSIDREQVIKAIREAKVTYQATRPTVALDAVQRIIEQTKGTGPLNPMEVHIFSDWDRDTWNSFPALNQGLQDVVGEKITFLAHVISPPAVPGNLSLLNTRWATSDPQTQKFEVAIKNQSEKPIGPKPVVFEVYEPNQTGRGAEVLRSENEFAGNETKVLPFEFRSRSKGVELGRVSLTGNDALAFDNELFFLVTSQRKAKVLVVDGEKDLNPFLSETFFVHKALGEGEGASSRFSVIVISPTEINQHLFSNYDLLVLANVESLPQKKIVELQSFLESGGGLFLTLGDQVNIQTFNKEFRRILPVALRDVVSEENGLGLRTLSFEEETRRIFGRSLSLGDLGLLEFVRVSKYFVFETQSFGQYRTLLSLNNGSPMLIWGKQGRGQFGVWSSTIDREWNDFPVQTTFLPFLQTFLHALASQDAFYDEMTLTVGETRSLPFVRDIAFFRMVAFTGNEVARFSIDGGVSGGRLPIQAPAMPGPYWLEGVHPSGEVMTRTLIQVQVSQGELKNNPISPENLAEWQSVVLAADGPVLSGAKGLTVASEDQQGWMFNSFFPLLVVLLVAFFLGESFVSAR